MLHIYRIRGHSLEPEYQPGDFVIASKIPFFFHTPKTGEVVIFAHAEYGLLIKHIQSVDTTTKQLTVMGTHPYSVDSRQLGAIALHQIIGKVLWHIHPKR